MKRILILLFFTANSLTTFAHKEKWDEVKKDWSPLMLAIYNGQTDKITKLIDQNVDVNFMTSGENSNWRLTALDVAIRMDNEDVVKKLLLTNRILKLSTYLMTACGQQNDLTVNLLIKYGANPNDTLQNGYAVSMMATSFGSLKILECLLKNGANVKQVRRGDGMTTLMFAAFNGDVEKVKFLLKYGADKYIKDTNGKTALSYIDEIYSSLKVSERTKATLRELLK